MTALLDFQSLTLPAETTHDNGFAVVRTQTGRDEECVGFGVIRNGVVIAYFSATMRGRSVALLSAIQFCDAYNKSKREAEMY